MGFRFRRSVRIIPGIRVNLSKTGASRSVGRRGATVNVGRRGIRGTVGLPGSGLSYTQSTPWRSGSMPTPGLKGGRWRAPLLGFVILVELAVLLCATR